jgi:arylsulfatase A-like enzyme
MRRLRWAMVVSLVMLGSVEARSEERARRPNILLLLTDDQRADCLGCAGHPLLKTPHIDKLAAQGVLFNNAFVTTAICCISRASIVTGQYARHHRVPDFATPLPPEALSRTFFALLRQMGYRIGGFGKWGIGGPAPKHLFDAWDAWGNQGPYFHPVGDDKVHNTEWLARKAVDFLQSCPKEQPFCLMVWFKAPHEPFLPDPRDAELFKNVRAPAPKTYTKAHFEALPPFLRQSLGGQWAARDWPTPEKHQEYVKNYLRLVAGVDRAVGKITTALEQAKRADDTLILYSADHGLFLGEHGLAGKWVMHEESIRVPFLIHYPRLPAAMRGKRLDEMALNIDIAPTILDFAGAKIPKETDGRSLKPLLSGQSTKWREHWFYEHHYHHGGSIPRTEGVRMADWSYITYFDVKYEELYDLKGDPLQERNLAGVPEYRERLSAMRALHREYVERLPPPVPPNKTPMKKKDKSAKAQGER